METALAERRPLVWILPLSAAIAGFLIWLIYLKTTRAPAPPWIGALPAANACFNSCSAVALAAGWRNIFVVLPGAGLERSFRSANSDIAVARRARP